MAYNHDYGTHFWKFWLPDFPALIWLVMSVMPILFFQTFIHEGSHVLTYISDNRGVDYLAPFPHESINTVTGARNTLNGAAGATTPTADTANIATPQFLAIGLLIALSLFLWLIPYVWSMNSRTVRLLFRAWYLGLCFDLLWNTAGKLIFLNSPGNDWNRYQAVQGYSNGEMFAFSLLILLIPLTYFAWGHFSAWHRDPPESDTFMGNFWQGFWDYRWAALVYFVLSLTAIIFSFTVDDPAINKDHWVFQIAVAFQIIYLVFYVVYFIMSFFFPRSSSSS